MSDIIMMVGFPASSKSTLVKQYESLSYRCLSRDIEGGGTFDLLPKMEALLKQGEDVILDCTFVSVDKRKPFIDLAKTHNCSIHCKWMSTSIEDCQINALCRMMDVHGRVFLDKDAMKSVNDPHVFPISVLFKMKKDFQKPKTEEGFLSVEEIKFVRKYRKDFTNRALFLDYDGTLREVTQSAAYEYPVKISDIVVKTELVPLLKRYQSLGYKLLGVSNQSGISKGHLTNNDAEICFKETNKQLGLDIEVAYCPHRIPPAICYCRKPQVGLAIPFIYKYQIDIPNSLMVGDMTSDTTFANRLGMNFMHISDFENQDLSSIR